MLFTRQSVNAGSRVMIPIYAVLIATYGAVYLFNPLGRLDASHGVTFQRSVAGGSMVPWGVVFLMLAGFLALQMYRESRLGYVQVLCIVASVWALWSCGYVVSIFLDDKTSLLAPVPTLFYTAVCIAQALTLLERPKQSREEI